MDLYPPPIRLVLTLTDFQEACFDGVERVALELASERPGHFPNLLQLRSRTQRIADLEEIFSEVLPPARKPLGTKVTTLLRDLDPSRETAAPNITALLERARDTVGELRGTAVAGPGRVAHPRFQLETTNDGGVFRIILTFRDRDLEPDRLLSLSADEWLGLSTRERFFAAVMRMCAGHRRHPDKPWDGADWLALEMAFLLVERGAVPPRIFHPILTTDQREYKTYLSFADPGPGHLEHTVRNADLLRGTIVHVEYIDRGDIQERAVTEAYRIPSIRHVAKLRIAAGDSTPCTVFIGRPVFENRRDPEAPPPVRYKHFQDDLLKSAHTIAAACSGMFALGVADCKLAMDYLSAKEAIEFMKTVAGNVIRDGRYQRLTAAFNLNTPLLDDRRPGGEIVRSPARLASIAVDLTRLGGFEKVAWDGAGDQASKPAIHQLSPVEWLKVIRQAHQHGLETYISAGMYDDHLPAAVQVGVGGVGIGNALHHRDGTAVGFILPNRVIDVLASRERAATTTAGRAANRVAQLDWQIARLSPHPEFEAQLQRTVATADAIAAELEKFLAAKSEGERAQVETRLEQLVAAAQSDADRRQLTAEMFLPGAEGDDLPPDALRPVSAGRTSDGVHPAYHEAAGYLAMEYERRKAFAQANQLDFESVPVRPAFAHLQELVTNRDLAGVMAWLVRYSATGGS